MSEIPFNPDLITTSDGLSFEATPEHRDDGHEVAVRAFGIGMGIVTHRARLRQEVADGQVEIILPEAA